MWPLSGACLESQFLCWTSVLGMYVRVPFLAPWWSMFRISASVLDHGLGLSVRVPSLAPLWGVFRVCFSSSHEAWCLSEYGGEGGEAGSNSLLFVWFLWVSGSRAGREVRERWGL
ncbi:hypothetical protein T484DRAFT_1990291 [Baffinella frigidus]|nr:hypothetical protein T484DRAFT_1990291 [Cryptophyta sp. CCMP2293]